MMPLAFEVIAVLASLAVGFVFGRIWEMRQEIRREVQPQPQELHDFDFRIPTAQLDYPADQAGHW